MSFSLIHAADFASRTYAQILPALQAGAIVLADRYVYTAFARDAARGVSRAWLRRLYSFAVPPTLAFYFDVPLDVAVRRILVGRPELKFYEAGLDLGVSTDPYESFRHFQGLIRCEYDTHRRRVRTDSHRRHPDARRAAAAHARHRAAAPGRRDARAADNLGRPAARGRSARPPHGREGPRGAGTSDAPALLRRASARHRRGGAARTPDRHRRHRRRRSLDAHHAAHRVARGARLRRRQHRPAPIRAGRAAASSAPNAATRSTR